MAIDLKSPHVATYVTVVWTYDELVELAKVGPEIILPNNALGMNGLRQRVRAGELVKICGVGRTKDFFHGCVVYGSAAEDTPYRSQTVPWTSKLDIISYHSPGYLSWCLEPYDELRSLIVPSRKVAPVDVMAGPGTPARVIGRYPHRCPKCGGAAYLGLFEIDCERKCGAK